MNRGHIARDSSHAGPPHLLAHHPVLVMPGAPQCRSVPSPTKYSPYLSASFLLSIEEILQTEKRWASTPTSSHYSPPFHETNWGFGQWTKTSDANESLGLETMVMKKYYNRIESEHGIEYDVAEVNGVCTIIHLVYLLRQLSKPAGCTYWETGSGWVRNTL